MWVRFVDQNDCSDNIEFHDALSHFGLDTYLRGGVGSECGSGDQYITVMFQKLKLLYQFTMDWAHNKDTLDLCCLHIEPFLLVQFKN